MTKEIRKVAVIGAGAMGAGIAAQAANAGLQVVLLDKRPDGAEKAVERMKNAKATDAFNAGFTHPSNAALIETGNTDDHMDKIADADIVIEAVFEDLAVKQNVFRGIEKHAREDAIIASNTSTIKLHDLTEGFSDAFKKRFMNTHFFNPVRFTHLLEIIDGPETDSEALKRASDFGDRMLGKKVVRAKDEPGFIGNRIGMYMIERAKTEAIKQNMTIEDVDAIFGPSFGFPNLGLFKLADEVGTDIVYHVAQNLQAALPADDHFHAIYRDADKVKAMIDNGYTGKNKGKGGFYRLKTDSEGKPVVGADKKPMKQVRDLLSNEFRDYRESVYFKKTVWRNHGSMSAFFDSDDKAAKLAWPVMRDMMLYVLDHAEDIAHSVQAVDEAMKTGYGWEKGPFEILDQCGVKWFTKKIEKEGLNVPPLLAKARGQSFYHTYKGVLRTRHFDGAFINVKREEGVIDLEDVKRKSVPVMTHNSASLWDIGDGVLCLEFHSKGNSIDPSILWVANESVKLLNENPAYKGMVIYNDGERFSVGANLKLAETFMDVADNRFAKMVGLGQYAEKGLKNFLHEFLYQGQAVYTAINQSKKPIIGAPKGQPKNMSLGGGNEILLSCAAVQTGPEQIMGLPEVGVGILPAWTGTTRILQRAFETATIKGAMAVISRAAMALTDPLSGMGMSAQDGRKKLWLRKNDRISMNPDRVLSDAKALTLEMAQDYQPKPLPVFHLPGVSGKAAIRMNVDNLYKFGTDPKKGGVNQVDVKVVDRVADVLTGGESLKSGEVHDRVADHQAEISSLASRKPENKLGVNVTIPLSWTHMMQLERENAMDAFNDKAATWPRVRHITAKGAPLREARLSPAPEPNQIRATMKHESLPLRVITGKPLSGKEAQTLKDMADMTAAFYGTMKRGMGKFETGRAAIMALSSVKKVLGNF